VSEACGDHNKAVYRRARSQVLDSKIYQNSHRALNEKFGRSWERDGEIRANMPSPVAVTHVEQFERLLLRSCVGALEEDRNRCVDCERSPLIGEHVHLYDGRGGGVVCELCRPLRRETPVATEIVRHSEHGHAVRLTARAA
jgi:hypothetical protein